MNVFSTLGSTIPSRSDDQTTLPIAAAESVVPESIKKRANTSATDLQNTEQLSLPNVTRLLLNDWFAFGRANPSVTIQDAETWLEAHLAQRLQRVEESDFLADEPLERIRHALLALQSADVSQRASGLLPSPLTLLLMNASRRFDALRLSTLSEIVQSSAEAVKRRARRELLSPFSAPPDSSANAVSLEAAKQLLQQANIQDPTAIAALSMPGRSPLSLARAFANLRAHLTPFYVAALLKAGEHAEPLSRALLANRLRGLIELTAPQEAVEPRLTSSRSWWEAIEHLLLTHPADAQALGIAAAVSARWTALEREWWHTAVAKHPAYTLEWAYAWMTLKRHQQLTLENIEVLLIAPTQIRALLPAILGIASASDLSKTQKSTLISALLAALKSTSTADLASSTDPRSVADHLVTLYRAFGNLEAWPLLLKEATARPQHIKGLHRVLAQLQQRDIATLSNILSLLIDASQSVGEPYTHLGSAFLQLAPTAENQHSLLTPDTRWALTSAHSKDPYAVAVAIRQVSPVYPPTSDYFQRLLRLFAEISKQEAVAGPTGEGSTFRHRLQQLAQQLSQMPPLSEDELSVYAVAHGDPERHTAFLAWKNAPQQEKAERWLRLFAYPYGNIAQTLPANTQRLRQLAAARQLASDRGLTLPPAPLDWVAEALRVQPKAYQNTLIQALRSWDNYPELMTLENLAILLSAPQHSFGVAQGLRRAWEQGMDASLARSLVRRQPDHADRAIENANHLEPPIETDVPLAADVGWLQLVFSADRLLSDENRQALKNVMGLTRLQPDQRQLVLQAATIQRAPLKRLTRALEELELSSPEEAFTETWFYLLYEPATAAALADGLAELEGILDRQHPNWTAAKNLLVQNPLFATSLAKGIAQLSSLSSAQDYFPLLLQNADQAEKLGSDLARLNGPPRLTPAVRRRLFQGDAPTVAEQLVQLKERLSTATLEPYLADPNFLAALPLSEATFEGLVLLTTESGLPRDAVSGLLQTFGLKPAQGIAFKDFMRWLRDKTDQNADFISTVERLLTPLNLAIISEFPSAAPQIIENVSALEQAPMSAAENSRQIMAELARVQAFIRAQLTKPLNPATNGARTKRALGDTVAALDPDLRRRWGVPDSLTEGLPEASALKQAIDTLLQQTQQSHGGRIDMSGWSVVWDSLTPTSTGVEFFFSGPPNPVTGRVPLVPVSSEQPALLQLPQWQTTLSRHINRAEHAMFLTSLSRILIDSLSAQNAPPGKTAPYSPEVQNKIVINNLGLAADSTDTLLMISKKVGPWALQKMFPSSAKTAANAVKLVETTRAFQGLFRGAGRLAAGVDILLTASQLSKAQSPEEQLIIGTQLAFSSTSFVLSIASTGVAAFGPIAAAGPLGIAAFVVGIASLPVYFLIDGILQTPKPALQAASSLVQLSQDAQQGFQARLTKEGSISVDFNYRVSQPAQRNAKVEAWTHPVSEIDYRTPGVLKYAINGATIHRMKETREEPELTFLPPRPAEPRMDPEASKAIPFEEWAGIPSRYEQPLPAMSPQTGIVPTGTVFTQLPECRGYRWTWEDGWTPTLALREDAALQTIRRWSNDALSFEDQTTLFPWSAAIKKLTPHAQATRLTVYLDQRSHGLLLPTAARPVSIHLQEGGWRLYVSSTGVADVTLIAPPSQRVGNAAIIDASQSPVDPFDPKTLYFRNGVLTIGNASFRLEGCLGTDQQIQLQMPGGVQYRFDLKSETLRLEGIDLQHQPAAAALAVPPNRLRPTLPEYGCVSQMNAFTGPAEQQAVAALELWLAYEVVQYLTHQARQIFEEQLAGRIPSDIWEQLIHQYSHTVKSRALPTIQRWIREGGGKTAFTAYKASVYQDVRKWWIRIKPGPGYKNYSGEFSFPPPGLSLADWLAGQKETGLFGVSNPLQQLALEAPERLPAPIDWYFSEIVNGESFVGVLKHDVVTDTLTFQTSRAV